MFNDLLTPYPADLMTASPVSRLVNSPATDTPACIVPSSEPFFTFNSLLLTLYFLLFTFYSLLFTKSPILCEVLCNP